MSNQKIYDLLNQFPEKDRPVVRKQAEQYALKRYNNPEILEKPYHVFHYHGLFGHDAYSFTTVQEAEEFRKQNNWSLDGDCAIKSELWDFKSEALIEGYLAGLLENHIELKEYKACYGECPITEYRDPTEEELKVMQEVFPSPDYSFYIKYRRYDFGCKWIVRAKEYDDEFFKKQDEAIDKLYALNDKDWWFVTTDWKKIEDEREE